MGNLEPPGQTTLNQFELAILSRIADAEPALRELIPKLHVLSREFTGVGSYTKFRSPASTQELKGKPINLHAPINVPGIKYGMGAVLFFKDGRPDTLETYTFGNEMWNGIHDGFSIPGMADGKELYDAFGRRRPARSEQSREPE